MSFFLPLLDATINKVLTKALPYPRSASIDPVNVCQLNCPLCPTGARRSNYDCKVMPLATFELVIDKMPFLREIELYRSGESFLNPDIFAMTRYAADRKIKVTISTNFSFSQPNDFFENIVTSGLDRLIVSLDGTSQESYAQYRKGGNYELVLANLKQLIAVKRSLNAPKPEIIWQFLVSRFNEQEIASAREISEGLGVTAVFAPMDLTDELPDIAPTGTIQEKMNYWLPEDHDYWHPRYKREHAYPLFPGMCKQLFTRVVVAVDGKILPCCETWDRDSTFGDLSTQSFDEIWQGQHYLNARLRFLEKGFTSDQGTVCDSCRNFERKPSLKDKFNLLKSVLRAYLGR